MLFFDSKLGASLAKFWLDERGEAGNEGGNGDNKDGEIPANITEMVNGAMAKLEGTAIPGAMKPLKDDLAAVKTGLSALTDSVKTFLETQNNGAAADDADADDDPPKTASGKGAKHDAEMRAMRKTLDTQGEELKEVKQERETARQEADTAKRKSAIAGLLSSLHFVDEDASSYAADFFMSKVALSDEGDLMVGDITLPEFVTKTMEGAFAGLLKSDAGGSGQRHGGGGGRKTKTAGVQIEDIVGGMSAESQDQAWKDVKTALQG